MNIFSMSFSYLHKGRFQSRLKNNFEPIVPNLETRNQCNTIHQITLKAHQPKTNAIPYITRKTHLIDDFKFRNVNHYATQEAIWQTDQASKTMKVHILYNNEIVKLELLGSMLHKAGRARGQSLTKESIIVYQGWLQYT